MKRTWMLLIGATLLWLCVGASGQESIEPTPGDGADVEVKDPGLTAEPPVVGEGIEGEIVIADEGSEDSGSVDAEKPIVTDEGTVEGSEGDGGREVPIYTITSEGGEGEGEPVVVTAQDGSESGVPMLISQYDGIDLGLNTNYVALALGGEAAGAPSLGAILGDFAQRVGLPEGFGLPETTGLDLLHAPQMPQLWSGMGGLIAEEAAVFANPAANLPDLSGPFNSAMLEVSTQTGVPIPAVPAFQIPGLPANP